MREPGHAGLLRGNGDGLRLQAEQVPPGSQAAERAIQRVENMQHAVLAVGVAPAHAADADEGRIQHPGHPLQAAKIAVGVPPLQNRNEAVGNAAALAAA